jgi:RecB family exonuclease
LPQAHARTHLTRSVSLQMPPDALLRNASTPALSAPLRYAVLATDQKPLVAPQRHALTRLLCSTQMRLTHDADEQRPNWLRLRTHQPQMPQMPLNTAA